MSIGVLFDSGTGELTLTGTTGTDQVSVVGQTTYLDIYVDGTFQARLLDGNSTNVTAIAFDGDAGDDSLAVQNIQPTGSLAIDLTGVESLSVLKGGNVAVAADAALELDTSSIAGTLDVSVDGELTQAGQVVVAKATTLDVGVHDITLTHAANNFATLTIASAQNVALCDVNAVVLGDASIFGDLSIQANLNSTSRVAISQAAGTTLSVAGATTLTVGPASTITLNKSGNYFTGTVSVTAAATVTLCNDLATDLGESKVTRNLSLTALGDVTQSGALVVGQTATVSATGYDIDLSNSDNNFRTVALKGANVVLNDVNAVILGTSTVTGMLDVTADGTITQSGALKATAGLATLTAGETNNITLSNSGNDFLSVGIVAANNVVLRDMNALDLAESTVSGLLTVTTAGDVTQSGVLTVAGRTTLTAGSTKHVTLWDPANDFGELRVVSGRNVAIADVGELILYTSRIYGTLAVSTGDSLTQSGALTVTGIATFTLAAGDLILDTATNNFARVVVAVPGDVWIRDTNAIVLGNFDVGGNLTLQANLNSTSRTALSQYSGTTLTVGGSTTLAAGPASTITLNRAGNILHGSSTGEETVSVTAANATLVHDADLMLGASSVSRNLTVTAAGGMAQSGPVLVGRVATLSAAADIVLTDPENDFATLSAEAVNVSINDLSALVLGASTVVGDLDATTEGAITQNGALNVSGLTTLSAGLDNDIVLLHALNEFSSVGVASGRNVALRDQAELDLAASTISGALAVTTAGAITQSGALEVAEKATLTAGAANDITLADTANLFSEISVVSGNNVFLLNSEALILASSVVSGALDVVVDIAASGGLSQSGAVVVAGTATLSADGQDIELVNTGNNFATLAVTGDNVWLRDINGVELGDCFVFGDLSLTTGNSITQTVGTSLTVTGAAALATNPSAGITLGEANSLSEVAVTSAGDVTLHNAGPLILGASNVSGALAVATGGDLTQSGALAVAGSLTLDAGGASIDLSTEAANDFATVTATGLNVFLQTSNAIELGDATAFGDLSVQAGGSITDSGTISVAGLATLLAGNDITLDSAASAYAGALSLHGTNISVFNTVATVLGDCTATGDLTVVASATLTNSGDGGATIGILTVAGTATLDAGASPLTLYTNGCTFGVLVTIGSPVTIIP